MKFKGRNGGMALAVRNHIMMFRAFLISFLVFLIPTIIFIFISNPYFWVFMILPFLCLVISFAVFLFAKHDENVFLSQEKKDHIFEIKNDSLFKDGKEIKLINSIKIYRYKNFLYMETSHSMFVIQNTDFILSNREDFLDWAKSCHVSIKLGYWSSKITTALTCKVQIP